MSLSLADSYGRVARSVHGGVVGRPCRGSRGTTVVCVQPQEPVTGSAPQPAAEAGEKASPRRRRLRLWLAVAAGVLSILCAGGIGVAVLLYDEETKIDRAEPDAVVDNFLRAYLVNRDDERASLYQCKSDGKFQEIANYRADVLTREERFSVGIRVTWSTFKVLTNDATGTVTTDLTKTTSDQSGRVSNSWQFEVVDQDGWRVCGATALS